MVFEGQEPFTVTSDRYGLLVISELMDSDCLCDPNTFPVGWCRGQQEDENMVASLSLSLSLYVHGESLYIPG